MSSVEQQALAILERGRERIARGWCQGASARDSRGKFVPANSADSPEAVSWCAAGGLGAWGGERLPPAWDAASNILSAHLPPGATSLATWNDGPERRQTEVLALYDKAIADLRAQLEASDG